MPHDARQSLGKAGEEIACRTLRRLGYDILARRYRTRFGEIDIVAKDGDTIVFLEVKSRTGVEFGGSAAAVTVWKQRRIADMAVEFLARGHLTDHPCRFDVVTVDFTGGKPRVQVYPNAFVTTA